MLITASLKLTKEVCAKILTRTFAAMAIKVGDRIPSVKVTENNPDTKIDIAELFAKKKVVLFAVPGAFTPGCSKTHLPGFVEQYDDIKKKGVDMVACISVNDPFVMEAWGKAHGADGKIRMLADVKAEFAKAIGMEVDATEILGNIRTKRYSMIIEDGVVKQMCAEPDGFGLTCSLAPDVLKLL